MPAITPEPIMKIAMGFMAAKHLFVASEIGLFEALGSGPASLEDCKPDRGPIADSWDRRSRNGLSGTGRARSWPLPK